MPSRWLTKALFLAALLPCVAAADDGQRYRVSGIILNPDRPLAMIEGSDGEQTLLRPGDRLGPLSVETIDAEGVILTDGMRLIFLPLQGEPTALGDLQAIARTRALQSADGNASQAIDFRSAAAELAQLRQTPVAAKTTPDVQRREEERLGQRLNRALGLPSHAVIEAVDRRSVKGPEAAIPLLAERIEKGRSVRLEVDGLPGIAVLYLTPDYSVPPPRPQPN